MTTKDIVHWIDTDELWRFYKSSQWLKLKKYILSKNHYECSECRNRGIITRHELDKNGQTKLISTVHHRFHVRKHPEFALSEYVSIGGKTYQNLIPVCKACHNRLHPEKNKNRSSSNKFTNEEWW